MAFSIECFSIMLIFSMPRSGSTAFAEKMAVDNDLINNKEFFNRNVRGFNPHLGTYVIKGDLYSIGNFTKVDCENLKPNLPCNMNDRIEILKNGPLNIDDYVVKILPHHVSWVSEDLINHLNLMGEMGYAAFWCAGSLSAIDTIKGYMNEYH